MTKPTIEKSVIIPYTSMLQNKNTHNRNSKPKRSQRNWNHLLYDAATVLELPSDDTVDIKI